MLFWITIDPKNTNSAKLRSWESNYPCKHQRSYGNEALNSSQKRYMDDAKMQSKFGVHENIVYNPTPRGQPGSNLEFSPMHWFLLWGPEKKKEHVIAIWPRFLRNSSAKRRLLIWAYALAAKRSLGFVRPTIVCAWTENPESHQNLAQGLGKKEK